MKTALKFKARMAGNMRIVAQTIMLHTHDALARRREEQLALFRLVAPVPLKAACYGDDHRLELRFEDNARETIVAQKVTRREREQTQRVRLCV